MRWLVGALVGVFLASPASAYLKAGPNVAGQGAHHRLQGGATNDTMATALSAAYSFRKVRSAYAGSAVKLRRTTGGTQDIGFTAQGDFDTTASATFCAATTCFIDTWYDQSGNARHATQATTTAQPTYLANCGNGLPCMTTSTESAPLLATASFTPVLPVSISGVAKRDVMSATYCHLLGTNATLGNDIFINSGTQEWALTDGAGFLVPPAPDGGWHAAAGVINGASSVIRLDSNETTGSAVGSTTAGAIWLARKIGATSVCYQTEALLWSGYGLTASERLALATNQQNYYAPLPLDTFATPAGAYSMRRLKSSYSGPAIRLRRASDNAEQDINFLSFTGFTGAPIDTAAAAAFCNATTCFLDTWYDQSGGARHMVQATTANQPQYVADCGNGLPCMRSVGSAAVRVATVGSVTPSAVMTLNGVARRTGSADVCYLIADGNLNTLRTEAANTWVIAVGTGLTGVAADGVWHSGTGVINGAGTVLRIDATETTGSLTGNLTANPIQGAIGGAGGVTCDYTEALVWDNYALTAGERAVLNANQQSFWGF